MKKLIALAITAFVVLILLLAAALKEINAPASPTHSLITVIIAPGMHLSQTARALEAAGAVKSAATFTIVAKLHRLADRIKAGEYELDPGQKPVELLRQLVEGRVKLHSFTVPEGFTMRQIAGLAAATGLCTADDFLASAADKKLLGEFAITAGNAEGYLMPDTYHFRKEAGANAVVRAMLATFMKKTAALRQQNPDKADRLHQIVTLASIVEKEAAGPDEYPVIAAVFYNRLRRSMPLQADPTVIYAIQDFDGNIHKKDLSIDSPYNTYRYRGLPPGPIANPGMGALEAVYAPASVNYLYFVAMGKVKKHQFSATLKEHNEAVRKYQLGGRG